MTHTLSTLIIQVSQYLDDPNLIRYPESLLTAAVRLALGEYNLLQAALGLPLAQLAGLDGAELTSLPEAHESMLVEGAAGHAAAMRQASREEINGLERPDPARLAEWSSQRLEAFRRMLADIVAAANGEQEKQRLAGLRAQPSPLSTTGWPLDEWDVAP